MNRLIHFSFFVSTLVPWNLVAAAPVATLKNIDQNIQSASLDESGKLVVTYWENNCIATRQLSEATTMRLNYLAATLADAETLAHNMPRKCLVIIDPRYVFELAVQARAGEGEEMKTVLTLQSCSLETYIHPSNPQLETNAYLLKEVLWTEAHEAGCPK